MSEEGNSLSALRSQPPQIGPSSSRGPPDFSPEDALSLFTQKLDDALQKQKDDIFSEMEARFRPQPADPVVSVPKATPIFRYEANAKQFDFNSARLEEVTKVINFIKRGSNASAVDALEKCSTALKECNKILRITDKYGWDVVEEYTDDPLTDGSDDATKLRQAEYRAKMKRREKQREKYAPYSAGPSTAEKPNTSHLFRDSGSSFGRSAPKHTGQGSDSKSPGISYSPSEYFSNSYGGKTSNFGRCYYCNDENHWAYNCPRKTRSSPSRPYRDSSRYSTGTRR